MKDPRKRWMRCAAMFSLAALLGASLARAQPQSETLATGQPPTDLLTAVQQKTTLGDTLRVVMNDGTERKGILAEASATSVTLIVKGSREVVAERDTRRVVRENPDSVRNGARSGAIVGGAIIAALLLPSPRAVDGSTAVIGIGMYVGTGAAIGAGIDALIKDHTAVYDRPTAPRASMSVAPLLSPHRGGVRIAIVW